MQAFPNDAPDARILWQRAEPSLRKVALAACGDGRICTPGDDAELTALYAG